MLDVIVKLLVVIGIISLLAFLLPILFFGLMAYVEKITILFSLKNTLKQEIADLKDGLSIFRVTNARLQHENANLREELSKLKITPKLSAHNAQAVIEMIENGVINKKEAQSILTGCNDEPREMSDMAISLRMEQKE